MVADVKNGNGSSNSGLLSWETMRWIVGGSSVLVVTLALAWGQYVHGRLDILDSAGGQLRERQAKSEQSTSDVREQLRRLEDGQVRMETKLDRALNRRD